MKKSTRILAILMAFAMLLGSFTVMGSAYEAYKGNAIKNSYNDIDVPVFSTEQHASMALDELDRMLAKEQIYLNIYIGELDLASLNTTIASVESLLGKVSTLLPLLGDAASLDISAVKGNKRSTANAPDSGNVSDVEFITDLFDFLGDIAPIAEKYVNGTVSLGILNGFIADFIFDVRELAIGLVYGMTAEGEAMDFDAMEDGDKLPEKYINKTNGAITLLQDLLNQLVLGEWVKLDNYFDNPALKANVFYNMYSFADDYTTDADKAYTGKYDYYGWVHPDDWVLVGLGGCIRVTEGATAPAPIYTAMNITGDVNGYDFIETLLQRAFNYLLVPTLNNQTRHALRKWCGVEYLDRYTDRTVYNPATGMWDPNPEYNPAYTGEEYDTLPDNIYNKVFNVNAYMQKVEIPAGETLIDNFNNILGDFLGADGSATGLIKDPVSEVDSESAIDWTWTYGGNEYLFKNIVTVAKYVIQKTGNALFADYVKVPTPAELEAYTDQQIVAFVLRAIFNASVDWMYIPEEGNETILDVCYTAVEQLAFQDIPQFTYTKPDRNDFTGETATQDYYDALIDKALDILLDVAVYNLNQSIDAVEASGANPVTGAGLIPYQGDNGSWEDTATVVASWAVNEYGPLLAIFDGLNSNKANNSAADLTMAQVWADIDTIVDSLIPIKPNNAPWICTEISESGLIAKAFIFDYIAKPVYTLDATNFAKIFSRNESGSFASMNGVKIIVNILDNVFDLLFPNVFSNTAQSVDDVLDNELLGKMVKDLIMSLGTETFIGATNNVSITGRANNIVKVALPIVNMLLGLSDEQQFEEIEIYLPEVITAGEACTFSVYNGSSGINTGYTDKEGNFTQDTLYNYSIVEYVAKRYPAGSSSGVPFAVTGLDKGREFAGGDSVDVTINNGVLSNGDIVEFNITYTVTGETGGSIGDNPNTINTNEGELTKTVYAYVGTTDKDDDAIELEKPIGDRIIKYESEIYLASGDDLNDIESFGIRIEDNKSQESWQNTEDTNGDGKVDGSDNQIAPTINLGKIGTVSNTETDYAFVEANTDTLAAFSGQGGTYFLNAFKVAEGFERFEDNYLLDEEGNVVIDESTGKPVIDPANPDNGGVPNGDYKLTVPVTVTDKNGNNPVTENLTITIHIYDDFDLPGKFSSAVSRNRQQNQYSSEGEAPELWADYVNALQNAAKLALTPKVGSNFQTFIGANGATAGYENLYEKYAEELDAAIAALEPYALQTGVDGIKAVIAAHDGYNYETRTVQAVVNGETRTFFYQVPIEYYEDGYTFFGERDYVPHLYSRYRNARKDGQSLIDSQEFFVKAPFSCVEVYGENYKPSNEEVQEYNDSILAAAAAMDNARIIGSVEAAYAEHMLTLTSDRLIALTASKDKLDYALNELCVGVNAGGASYYTADSWEDYQNALTFAEEVNDEPITDAYGDPALSPTKVNVAMSELINAWKKLVESCDFTELDAQLAASKTYADLGTDQTTYTEDTYAKFYAAYTTAADVDRSMGKTDANQDEVDAIAEALRIAREGLVEAAAAEPTWGWITEDPDMWFCDFSMEYLTLPTTAKTEGLPYDTEWWFAETENGDMVEDFIIGVGEWNDEDVLRLIIPEDTLENCYVEVTPGKNPSSGVSGWGTGSVIQIYSSADDTLLKTYMVILYGDVNCDGVVTALDQDTIRAIKIANLYDYYDSKYGHLAAAADVNGSGDMEVNDADERLGKVLVSKTMYIDQEQGIAVNK